ncbi:hypothetical protein D9M68_849970 [compost metagenome]
MGGHVNQLTRKAVHTVTRYGLEGAGHGPARLPVRKETRNNGIAHGKLRYTRTYGRDNTRTIGHGDTSIHHTDVTGNYAKVVVVERAGMDAHLDLARLGGARGGYVDEA